MRKSFREIVREWKAHLDSDTNTLIQMLEENEREDVSRRERMGIIRERRYSVSSRQMNS
jgi:hypothetical protein